MTHETAQNADCPECEGLGWVPVVQHGIRRMMRCRCHPANRPSAPPGMPVEFQRVTLGGYRRLSWNEAAFAAAERYVAQPDHTRPDLFIGTTTRAVGCGKSFLAACVLTEIWSRATACAWFSVPLLLRRLQPPQDDDDAHESSALERHVLRTPVIVLDDLGAERDAATDYTRRTLLLIHEERWGAGFRTIWTSNMSLGQLAEMQDDKRLASRLSGRAVAVAIDGPDQRPRVRRGEE